MRKLATIEQVHSIRPIPDADAIEVVRVRGWDVVAKIGDFQPGDLCVYFEIDSLIPVDQDRYRTPVQCSGVHAGGEAPFGPAGADY